jgi:hypothetical protein
VPFLSPNLSHFEKRLADPFSPESWFDSNVPEDSQIIPSLQHVQAGCSEGNDGPTNQSVFIVGQNGPPCADIELFGPGTGMGRWIQIIVFFDLVGDGLNRETLVVTNYQLGITGESNGYLRIQLQIQVCDRQDLESE